MPKVCLEHVTPVKMFMSVPFFYRMQNDNRHGDAAPERAGAREAGMSPGQEPVRARHAAEGRSNCIAAPHDERCNIFQTIVQVDI